MKSISFSVSDLKYKLLSKSSLIRPYNIFSENELQDIKQFHKGEDLKLEILTRNSIVGGLDI